jgi:hypothetical protein
MLYNSYTLQISQLIMPYSHGVAATTATQATEATQAKKLRGVELAKIAGNLPKTGIECNVGHMENTQRSAVQVAKSKIHS